jgi:hypothetical protein
MTTKREVRFADYVAPVFQSVFEMSMADALAFCVWSDTFVPVVDIFHYAGEIEIDS